MIKKYYEITASVLTAMFTLIPESFFESIDVFPNCTNYIKIVINRIILSIVVSLFVLIICAAYYKFRMKVSIKGHNYSILVKYGNLLKEKKCKIVIPFDECFNYKVGNKPGDIKKNSICGQYLQYKPIEDLKSILGTITIKPLEVRSKYQNQECYESGTLVPRENDLLLAFAKLDEDGLGWMSKEDYLNSLSLLWKEINKYYEQEDICIPILGSGITRFENGEEFTQQELLDMIIYSYKLSSYKINNPNKLIIVCKKRDDFSLNNIGICL